MPAAVPTVLRGALLLLVLPGTAGAQAAVDPSLLPPVIVTASRAEAAEGGGPDGIETYDATDVENSGA
ncbi:MAG TPA: hypothetical protein VEB66_05995, partial [Opitutaceae bacterium]|nr:hypothetical protein [Opitutaceae bacterium]